jgi:rhodanese-related sulfurtransferase
MIEIPRITPEGAKELVDGGERVLFVDARSVESYAKANEQIPGSLRVPPGDASAYVDQLEKTGATVVAYCTCLNEQSSARVVLTLRQAGYDKAFALLGGFDAWRDAGLPLEPLGGGPAHAPMP